ncbi:MAG: hypothetical protein IPH97_13300 [Ignavibacteriales bacterium]|nr:hypothetical protein [Ignavibacteriales bacterium]
MKKVKFILAGFLLTTLFGGCLQVDTKVNVNKDGSGTIEETVLMKDAVIQMFKEFAVMFDSTKSEDFQMFKEDELKTKAVNYGEGVEYVSGEKFSIEGYEGYKVVYSFKDINKIKLSPSPDDKVPFGDDMGAEVSKEKAVDDYLKFNFTKGNPSTLVINFPKPQAEVDSVLEDNEAVQDSAFNEDMNDKLTEMFDGLKMKLVINLNDDIDETDASFVDGNQVTVMQVDFSEILKHKDVMDKLQKSKPETMEQFKEAVGDIEGIKVEFKDKITIKF